MHLAKHTPRSDIHPAQPQPGVQFKLKPNEIRGKFVGY